MLTKQDVANRPQKLIASNKKARFDYEIVQTLEVGISLQGTEVKSLRQGKCNLIDAYCGFQGKHDYQLYIFNLFIAEYDFGNRENHAPKRVRKLLAHRHEALKLRTNVIEKGYTLVPLAIYFSGHIVKLEVALVKPKKKHDKREVTKERDVKRELDRTYKM